MFVSMIKSKVPKDVLLQLELQKGSDHEWTLTELRERLRAYIVARERAEHDSKQEPQRRWDQKQGFQSANKNENKFTKQYERQSTSPRHYISAESLISGDRKVNGYADKCRYCANRHFSDECTKFKTLVERKKVLKDSCYKCLKVGHKSEECRMNKLCVHCGEKNVHHRSLCPKKFSLNIRRINKESVHISDEIEESFLE